MKSEKGKINERIGQYSLLLASQSPRRQHLLRELGLDFEILSTDVEEIYPEYLSPDLIACYLADLKADSFDLTLFDNNTLIISADTIVVLGDEVLGKPANFNEAIGMLRKLSAKKHDVITAVCLKSRDKRKTFFVQSSVYFKPLSDEEIEYYVDRFQPYDKAGGYGIQEWIGYIGISKIEGSYFNIMGLPVKEFYEELLNF